MSSIEAFAVNMLDTATVAWSTTHPRPPETSDYIHLVRTCQRFGVPVPQWPEHVAIGSACEWAIVMPPPGDLQQQWHRTLEAMVNKYHLPQPLRIVVTNEQRDLLNAALWFVDGPVMLVTHAILQWRTPSPYVPCGVWWDTRAIVPVRQFAIPACEPAFWIINELVSGRKTAGDCTGPQCCRCGNGASEWDRDALPYCKACWPRWSTEWMTYRTQWIAKMDQSVAF